MADVRAIEDGLNELWQLANAGELGPSLVRAASMTVVIPLSDDVSIDAVAERLDLVAAVHPLRAIVLAVDETVGEPRARLASHGGRDADGDTSAYWEEIRLVTPRALLPHAVSSMVRLCVPNLPVVCWWPGQIDVDGRLFQALAEIADRLVIDSGRQADPIAGLLAVARVLETWQESVALTDLSWVGLTRWRLAIAEQFDVAADRELLDLVDRLSVEYERDSRPATVQSLLLVGWIASRLLWEPRAWMAEGRGSWGFNLVDGVRPVHAAVVRSRTSSVERGVRSVVIDAGGDAADARYAIEQLGDSANVTREIDGVSSDRTGYALSMQPGEVLSEALALSNTDRIYADAVGLLARTIAGDAAAR